MVVEIIDIWYSSRQAGGQAGRQAGKHEERKGGALYRRPLPGPLSALRGVEREHAKVKAKEAAPSFVALFSELLGVAGGFLFLSLGVGSARVRVWLSSSRLFSSVFFYTGEKLKADDALLCYEAKPKRRSGALFGYNFMVS